MDITSFSVAASSLKAARDLAALLLQGKIDFEVQQKVQEVMNEVANAQGALLSSQQELFRLQEENQRLKKRIEELDNERQLRSTVVFERPSYWRVVDTEKDGPFCQRCFDVDSRLIRLQGGSNDSWRCKACNSAFTGPGHVPPRIMGNRRL